MGMALENIDLTAYQTLCTSLTLSVAIIPLIQSISVFQIFSRLDPNSELVFTKTLGKTNPN